MKAERIYDPVQNSTITFLETAESSGGKRTLLEVEVPPGGGAPAHFHTRFKETLTAVSGNLSLLLGNEVTVLSEGEAATVNLGVKHRFFNASARSIVLCLDIQPGNRDFERAARVSYGLARDGKTTANNIPKNPLELAVIVAWSNTQIPSASAVLINPLFKQLLSLAKRRGVDQRLLETYG